MKSLSIRSNSTLSTKNTGAFKLGKIIKKQESAKMYAPGTVIVKTSSFAEQEWKIEDISIVIRPSREAFYNDGIEYFHVREYRSDKNDIHADQLHGSYFLPQSKKRKESFGKISQEKIFAFEPSKDSLQILSDFNHGKLKSIQARALEAFKESKESEFDKLVASGAYKRASDIIQNKFESWRLRGFIYDHKDVREASFEAVMSVLQMHNIAVDYY